MSSAKNLQKWDGEKPKASWRSFLQVAVEYITIISREFLICKIYSLLRFIMFGKIDTTVIPFLKVVRVDKWTKQKAIDARGVVRLYVR